MNIKSVDCQTLKRWLENNQAVLVDVREIIENQAEKIWNSNLIPLANIDVDHLPKLGDKKLIIHCRSGKRSFAACEKLLAQDPNLDIYNLEGGICAWKNSGYEVFSENKSTIPLERQVQIVAGLTIFLGTLFGFLFSKIFLFLPLFFGAGLTFAGLTGCCGLGILLAKLPFNKKFNNFCQIKK